VWWGLQAWQKLETIKMKRILFTALVAGAALSATVTEASLSFANLPGSSITFAGGSSAASGSSFTINGTATPDATLGANEQWQVTSGSTAYLGAFTGVTTWNYGAVSGPVGGTESANVTTPGGQFTLDDLANHAVVGNINWITISTYYASGSLNSAALINISGMTYGGSDPVLQALVNGGSGSITLSFSFATGLDLLALTTSATPNSDSYAGSIAAVPEPTTVLAGALLLLPLGASAFRILRRNRIG
jgi:hypothetical protein